MIQGLNSTISILRAAEGAKDSSGGAVRTESTIYTGVKCRISNPSRRRIEAMGLIEWLRTLNIIVWPATYAIYPGDIVVISSGKTTGRHIVLDVKEDSLGPGSVRAHITLTCERDDQARVTQ